MKALIKRRNFLISSLALLVLATLTIAPPLFASGYKIVVHESNPVTSVSRKDVSDLFLKRKTTWNHGIRVEPVDLVVPESLRESFCEGIHRRSVRAMKSYWNTQIFSGTATPPPQMTTEAQVLDYIKTHPGAIGYVSSSASVGSDLKVIQASD